jgi:hypothetical protein
MHFSVVETLDLGLFHCIEIETYVFFWCYGCGDVVLVERTKNCGDDCE